jgi:hypothetical protein
LRLRQQIESKSIAKLCENLSEFRLVVLVPGCGLVREPVDLIVSFDFLQEVFGFVQFRVLSCITNASNDCLVIAQHA